MSKRIVIEQYICNDCGSNFEHIKDAEPVSCPDCNSPSVELQYDNKVE